MLANRLASNDLWDMGAVAETAVVWVSNRSEISNVARLTAQRRLVRSMFSLADPRIPG